jgi:hypothetical protein
LEKKNANSGQVRKKFYLHAPLPFNPLNES